MSVDRSGEWKLRAEASALKEALAEVTLENRLFKRNMLGDGGDDE
jgi:transposase